MASRWYEVVAYLYSNPLVVYRTAHELKPFNGHVFVMAGVKKRTQIKVGPSLTINVFPGDTDTLVDQFVPALSRSGLPRRLMENLAETRSSAKVPKALGAKWVEQQLCKELERYGEASLNSVRDQALSEKDKLGMSKEFERLNEMISAVLATHSAEGVLTTPLALAVAKGEPFDLERIKLFESLAQYLKSCFFKPVPFEYNASSWRNLSFFESYFSNYIEGTEFEIDEAESIVFSRTIFGDRHEDSHDVLAVYDIVSDYQEMSETPDSAEELLEIIQRRHQFMMAQRAGKNPGKFKQKVNKAGASVFVEPTNLVGTLTRGFDFYRGLPKGMARAIYIQFLISECHPFDDGNGRLSRIMLNAELHEEQQCKIILPTVHRDSYLNGLRLATRQGVFRTLVKVFFQLQNYTAGINWLDYGEARECLVANKAHALPDEGVAEFNKHIRNYKMLLPSG